MLKPPGVSQTVFIFGALLVSFIVWVASRGELGIYLGFFGFGGGSVQGNTQTTQTTQTTQDLLKAQGGSTGILDTLKNWWNNGSTTPNNPLMGAGLNGATSSGATSKPGDTGGLTGNGGGFGAAPHYVGTGPNGALMPGDQYAIDHALTPLPHVGFSN